MNYNRIVRLVRGWKTPKQVMLLNDVEEKK